MDADRAFEVKNGVSAYLCRDGPARVPGATCSQKKLCFTATRRDLLARHLLELSRRADCYFVKLSVAPRDGMYLGRCFLLTDAAVGEVWAAYKSHPSIFCTVQDDDFVTGFRALAGSCDDLWLDDDHQRVAARDRVL